MSRAALIATVALLAAAGSTAAQDQKKAPNPVGASAAPPAAAPGQGWTTGVVQDGRAFDEKQMEAIKRVNGYFNGLKDLRSSFVQINPDAKRQRGKLAVKRPGRFRFDYNLPSKQIIISDGKYLAIQDLDIKTDDRFELDRTPFRMLLKTDVDLVRDARILDVQEAEDMIVISLQDKSPDAPGKIKLIIATKPAMELKEWVTTDAQNLDTRVELSGIDTKDEIDAKLFEIRSVALEKFQ
jgi:outer membrane lipoprotein-sorting protein